MTWFCCETGIVSMTRFKRWLRRLRTLLWTALTLIIIGAAVLVGVGKLLMPYSERYKPRLEAALSEQFNHPVRLESFTGEWKAFGPRISLEGVTLLGVASGDGDLAIERAALDIKPLNALLSGRPLYSFEIIGADLALTRDAQGRLELSGLGLSGRRVGDGNASSGLSGLARLGEVRLQDSSFSYTDLEHDIEAQLIGIDGRLQIAGDRLALEVQASLSNARRNRVLGDFAATVLADLRDGNQLENVRFQLETGELIMEELTARIPKEALQSVSGRLNAHLWGSWEPAQPLDIAGVVDLRDVSLPADGRTLLLDRLNSRINFRWHDKTAWRIDLADMRVEENGRDWTSPRIAVERHLAGNLGVWVSADYVQAEFPLDVTLWFMRIFGANWPAVAPTAGRGIVRDFELVIDANRQLAATSGRFEALEVLDWGQWPLARGLEGRIDLAFGEGSLWFSGEDVLIRWPRNFRTPLVVDLPECELEILWTPAKDWQVDALDCGLRNDNVEALARVRIAKDEGKPRVDINASISAPDLARLHDYWPRSVISPKIIDWIGRGVSQGRLEQGRLVISGDMDEFPFRSGQGALLAQARITDASLNYAEAWPVANGVDADLRIDGPALTLKGLIGDIAGSAVQTATAQITDLQSPILTVDYRSDTSLPLLKTFIERSPLLANSSLDLVPLEFEGPATTRGQLRIPLGSQAANGEKTTVDGELMLAGGRFLEARSGFALENLTGPVAYNRDGATAQNLGATLSGWPAALGLTAAWNTEAPFAAELAGQFPASLVISATPLIDDPALVRVSGEADWRGRLTTSRPEADGPIAVWLELESDLEGVVMELPAPLAKTAAEKLPLLLRYPLGQPLAQVSLTLGERMDLALELEQLNVPRPAAPAIPVMSASDTEPVDESADLSGAPPGAPMASPVVEPGPVIRRGALALGSPAQLPADGMFTLTGQAARLDLDGWISLAGEYAGVSRRALAMDLSASALQADQLIMLNRSFADVTLTLDLQGNDLNVVFDSEALAGTIRYTRNDGGIQSLTANLQRLHMPEPLDTGVTMDTDPATLPEMHFFVEDMRYLGLDLGETRIEAFPIGNGLRIESVEAMSSQLSFQARGDWVSTDEGSRSDFDIVLTSESLGTMVQALDISSVLEGGQTMVRYDAWWPGPPGAFSLAALNGQMTFSVIDGRILNADPGAGRVLGLMSVGALPRRLALDFSDVFNSGFGFDQASGTMDLERGLAYTDDFLLESTAARLALIGTSDLETKEFDYQMTVRPGVSQALPVIGALAAGPAGAAAGLALQGLFRKALGDAAEARYEITGPWSDPSVVRLDDKPGETSSPESGPDQDQDQDQPPAQPPGQQAAPGDSTPNGASPDTDSP